MLSTLDLQRSYHQIVFYEESRDLTVFIMPDGLFCFKRVPYGLASASAAFHRRMSLIFKNQKGVQCYLDYIIVFGNTPEEHELNLQSVLSESV